MTHWMTVAVSTAALACAADVPEPATGGQDATVTTEAETLDNTGDDDASKSTGSTAATTGDGHLLLDVGPEPGGPAIPPLADPVPFPATCAEAAEIPSSVGCEFYPLALPQSDGQHWDTAFIVSNVAPERAHVVLEDRDGPVSAFDLEPGASRSVIMGPEHQLLPTTGLQRRGYKLTSDQVLQLFIVSPPERSFTADATTALPRNALGQRHRIVTYPGNYGSPGQAQEWVVIAATEDDTQVTVELSGDDTITLGGQGFPPLDSAVAGQNQYTVTINSFDVLVVAASAIDPNTGDADNDITGSLVHSDKPVAVFSGTIPVYVPQPPVGEGLCCADLLAEAVPPTAALGYRYAAVKFDPLGQEPDLWRFVGDRDGTTVTLSGGLDDVIELEAGQVVDIVTQESFIAEGTHAFALVHFMTGSELVEGSQEGPTTDTADCGPINTPGDPAMSWVYARGNWLTRYLFTVDISEGTPWCRDRFTVVAPAESWDLIEHNGDALPPGEPLGDGELLQAYVAAEDGTHDLWAPEDVGFEVTVYGYADDGSYVFAGGMGVQSLNPAG